MVPAFLLPLLQSGLTLLANGVLVKGKEWVKESTGVDLDKASLTTDDLVKLKQLEIDHEEELIRLRQNDDQLSARIEEMYLQDRQSARDMQKEALKQGDIFSKRFVQWFAVLWTLAAMVYIALITFMTIPPANVRIVDTVLGFLLGTAIASILNFFYGSTRNSSNKDDTMADVVKTVLASMNGGAK